ncbi:MAG: hypothetical protein ACYDBB_26105 [Armatimonadota bacterium]
MKVEQRPGYVNILWAVVFTLLFAPASHDWGFSYKFWLCTIAGVVLGVLVFIATFLPDYDRARRMVHRPLHFIALCLGVPTTLLALLLPFAAITADYVEIMLKLRWFMPIVGAVMLYRILHDK